MTLQGYASPDHHLPTAKRVILDDVTGSITFTTASLYTFMPVVQYVLSVNLLSCMKRVLLLS